MLDIDYDYASNEQIEIDRLVYQAYGLNEADIQEVEDWYMRRYSKLATAQRANLAALQNQPVQVKRTLSHIYCDESRHLAHDQEPFMLLGLIHCPANKVRSYHLELRDLCRAHNLTDDYEMKWTHVRPGKLTFYEAVISWYLGKDDISFRALLLPEKDKIYERLPEDSQDTAYYRLYAQLLRSAIEPDGHYRIFLDKKDTRGGEKCAELTSLLRDQADDAYGDTILSLQQMQSHEARLMQLADLLIGAMGAARKGDALPHAKQALVTQLSEAIGSPLEWDTTGYSTKFSAATYLDFDSLVS